MQTAYELVWTFSIDPEIGAREREQNGEVSLADKDCVETNPPFVRPPQTQRERDWRAVCRITKRACDEISTTPAVKDAPDHLQFGSLVPERFLGRCAKRGFNPFGGTLRRLLKRTPMFLCKTYGRIRQAGDEQFVN